MPDPYLVTSLPDHELAELHRLMTEEIREVAVFFMDPEGVITVWNRAAEEMKGYPPDEAIGQHLRLLYTDDDRARGWPEHNLREAAKTGFYREESWRKRRDGTLFWASISLTALRNAAGELVGYSKITLDLTEHRKLEKCLQEKEENVRILQAARAGTWKWDRKNDRVEVSPGFLELLGYRERQPYYTFDQWIDFLHPDERQSVSEQLHAAWERAPGSPLVLQVRVRQEPGDYRWFYVQVDRYQGKGGERLMMGVSVDMQEMKNAQEERERLLCQLQWERDQAQVTLTAIADGVISTDLEGRILSINPAAATLTGWPREKARGLPITEVFHARDQNSGASLPDPVSRCLEERRVIQSDANTMLISRQGRQYSIESSAAPVKFDDDTLVGAVLAFHDVTESRQLLTDLRYQRTHDALTGLINRAEFEAHLKEAIERAQRRDGSNAVLLYIDLDQFKIVNDTCGHPDGDELLRQLAQLYMGQMRDGDTLARIGGDEFAMIVEGCSVDGAVNVANQILGVTKRFRFGCKGHVFQVGVSIGLITVDAHSSTVEELLREADHACYLAKEAGRNKVYVQQSGDVDIAQRRSDMQWVRRLEEARRNNELELYCQRIMPVSAGDGGLHYEVLLRFPDRQEGIVGPSTFMPAAERYDVMPSLDRWVLRESLQWLERNPEHVGCLEMCTINLSRRTLADEAFRDYAHELFDATEIPANKICFEITENGAIANMATTLSFIDSLARRGCRFALDDFGTGMTSFSYLKQLPVDFIKIDGSFIQQMIGSAVDLEMVRFTNDISHMMGRKTIAEHVTSDAIMQKLREIGVDYAQGNWLGAPHPLIR